MLVWALLKPSIILQNLLEGSEGLILDSLTKWGDDFHNAFQLMDKPATDA